MIYTPMTKKAINLMYLKHQHQVDKAGMPYVFHPMLVAEKMEDEDTTVVALLHDIIEDTDVTVNDLLNMGFTKEQVDAIDTMTHREDEEYFDYIERIGNNNISIKVKIADLEQNMDLSRLNEITRNDLIRVEKYKKSHEYLSSLLTNENKYRR